MNNGMSWSAEAERKKQEDAIRKLMYQNEFELSEYEAKEALSRSENDWNVDKTQKWLLDKKLRQSKDLIKLHPITMKGLSSQTLL